MQMNKMHGNVGTQKPCNKSEPNFLRENMNSPRTPQKTLSAELRSIINDRNILTTRTRMKVLSALDEINRENSTERKRSLRSQAIQEILTSEVAYLHQLELIMEFFMEPMFDRKLLTHASYMTLFGNIETIYNVNGELLKELKRNPDNIAQAFYKLAPFFKLYSVYAYDYKQALILLQGTQKNDQAARNFITQQETRPEVGRKLSALLIAPIQRIPRYRLLLKEVLQHTSTKDRDYRILQASLAEVEKAANHINALVAEHEDTQQLLDLQKHINGSINLIKPGRKLIKQGTLMRVSRGGSASYRRHFVLLSDTLLYCKGDPEISLTVCCLLPLNKCTIQKVFSGGLFRVTCLQESLLLYSETGDSEAWIQVLQDTVKKYIECRQTLRKDSSSRRPLRNSEVTQFSSASIPVTQIKRKRSTPNAPDLEDANVSTIIYINPDHEGEETSDESSDCFPLGRFKRLRTDNAVDKENRKWWIERFISKQRGVSEKNVERDLYKDSLYPLRRTIDKVQQSQNDSAVTTSKAAGSSLKESSTHSTKQQMDSIDLDAIQDNFSKHDQVGFPPNLPTESESQAQRWYSLQKMSQFMVSVGSSLRDIFRFK